MIKLTPLSDNVIAIREKAGDKTSGGLFLPDAVRKQTVYATVSAIGSKVQDVKIGDNIIYKDYCSTDVKIDDVEYLIIKEEDILTTLKDDEK